jgi:6-phosphofructokinase 1
MNAAIRAVVRKAIFHGLEVVGVRRGFAGLVGGDFLPMQLGSVADIIHRGGTVLRTARAPEFLEKEIQEKAARNLRHQGIDTLVVIGGDGSFRGASALACYGVHALGIPATIDNDVPCTENCIGFDTAVNNVTDAINKVRDTATSHERVYVIEVMGRSSGHIALAAGLAGGAESILVPEVPHNLSEICRRLERGVKRGKLHSIILVAEGAGSALEVGEALKKMTNMETRVTILGHLQRGGTPTAYDRMLASRLGAAAVDTLLEGCHGKMVGLEGGKVRVTAFAEVFRQNKEFPEEIYRLATILAI